MSTCTQLRRQPRQLHIGTERILGVGLREAVEQAAGSFVQWTLALRLSGHGSERVPALPDTPLPPSPIPFELTYPTWQPPPAPVVTGQSGLVTRKVHGALALHALLAVVDCEHDRHRDQHPEHHEQPEPAPVAALGWLMTHEARITPGRRRFLHHRAAVRQRLATIKRPRGRCAARTSRPGAGCGGHGRCPCGPGRSPQPGSARSGWPAPRP